MKGAAKVFAKRRLELSWQIEGVPRFITTTHRDKCSLCEQYAEHAVAALEKLTVEIPSHQIELAFRTAWPRVVECIVRNPSSLHLHAKTFPFLPFLCSVKGFFLHACFEPRPTLFSNPASCSLFSLVCYAIDKHTDIHPFIPSYTSHLSRISFSDRNI